MNRLQWILSGDQWSIAKSTSDGNGWNQTLMEWDWLIDYCKRARVLDRTDCYVYRRVSQMRSPLAACSTLAGVYNILLMVQQILIQATYIRIVIYLYINNTPSKIPWCPFFVILQYLIKQQYLGNVAIHPEIGCHNVSAYTCCSGCSPLGGINVKRDYNQYELNHQCVEKKQHLINHVYPNRNQFLSVIMCI